MQQETKQVLSEVQLWLARMSREHREAARRRAAECKLIEAARLNGQADAYADALDEVRSKVMLLQTPETSGQD